MTSVGLGGWLIAGRGSRRRRPGRRRGAPGWRRPCPLEWWLWRVRDPRTEPYPVPWLEALQDPVEGHRDEEQGQVREGAQIEAARRLPGGVRQEDECEADEAGAERQRRDQVGGPEQPRDHRADRDGHQEERVK